MNDCSLDRNQDVGEYIDEIVNNVSQQPHLYKSLPVVCKSRDKVQNEDSTITYVPIECLESDGTDIAKVCRTCLTEKDVIHSLFQKVHSTEYASMLSDFAAVQLALGDGLPENVCTDCNNLILQCYSFKQQCERSESILRTVYTQGYTYYLKNEVNDCSNVDFSLDEIEAAEENYYDDMQTDIGNINFKEKDKSKDCGSPEENESSTHNKLICRNDIKNIKLEDRNQIKRKYIKNEDTIKSKTPEKKLKEMRLAIDDCLQYICDFCSKQFSERQLLVRHLKIHSKDKPFKCSTCNMSFLSADYVRKHEKVHMSAHREDVGEFPCERCRHTFTSAHDLRLHQALHVVDGLYRCVECNKEFPKKTQLRRHITTHMADKPHKCRQCERTFAERCALKRHVRLHTGESLEKKHRCHLCNKRFVEKSIMEVHLRHAHTGERPWKCDECGKCFAGARLLKSHQRTHSDRKPYACKYCGKTFRHDATLTTHLRTHTGERPYICSVCGKTFIQSSNLTLHMRVHSGEKPYSCEICGNSFTSWSTMRTHIRIHTGEKPYACTQCGKKFARHSLKTHMLTHTGEKPHPCLTCHKAFATLSQLTQHKHIHTGEKPHNCTKCPKAFASKGQLKKHMKSHSKLNQKGSMRKLPKKDENILEMCQILNPTDILPEDAENDGITTIATIPANHIIATEDGQIAAATINEDGTLAAATINEDGTIAAATISEDGTIVPQIINLTSLEASSVNVVAVANGEFSISTANSLGLNAGGKKLYHYDQSLLRIQNIGGQLTISKTMSKVTAANFE